MNKRPQVCAVTGGSRGIGLATAIRFAGEGYHVSICGRDPVRLADAQQLIAAAQPGQVSVSMHQVDLTDSQAAQTFIAQTLHEFSAIDVLVNNAATATLSHLDEMSDADFEAAVNLNIRGLFYVTRSAWRAMKSQGSGTIVNISSQAAVDPFPGFSVYGSTKAWLELFSQALAGEGRAHGIRTYCVRPGAVETPMLRALFPDFPADQTVSAAEVAETVWAVCQVGFANSSGQVVSVSRQ